LSLNSVDVIVQTNSTIGHVTAPKTRSISMCDTSLAEQDFGDTAALSTVIIMPTLEVEASKAVRHRELSQDWLFLVIL
jgi:hypothetical protein